ncbi:endonuclease/exonuclease/phosphatase family protein [Salinimonas chungwhensis]|jgi:endonuclease/exonuclease/phosphatase family metal-dependent hydrolase|uniref:endonuclease/exonuclease/phosphatase family protein n=1 Tax=Salinimonas chungwhensis TaxID=265425 RepID=UPI00035D85A4|nr:endonuclease/exonuclease/phosphatase family protein [Salinimonas chungwhensis]
MCRIISYNIHSGVGRDKKHDYRRIGNYLAQRDADIVLLQEMDTRPAERSVTQDIHDICAANVYHLVPSPALSEDNGWYGNAVLTRFPVISNETLDVSQDGFQPRNIQAVVIDTPDGPLTVVNTHKGLKKHERRSQFALLHEYIAARLQSHPTPLILGGDFNEWQFFTSAFKQLNKTLNHHTVGATFPSQFPLFSLDRIWTTDDIRVKRIKKLKNTNTRILSDHLPVQVDIELPEKKKMPTFFEERNRASA